MVTPSLIGDALLALVLLVTTLATRYSTVARAQRKELKRLRAREEKFEDHVYDLRTLLAHHGIKRPPAPEGLFEDPYPEENDRP